MYLTVSDMTSTRMHDAPQPVTCIYLWGNINLRNRYPFSPVMGGPNLEIFKFTLYLVVPLAALIHFGSPEWYRTKVVPVSIVADSVSVFVFTFLQYRDKLFHVDRGSLVFSLAFKDLYIFLII